ncbi:MAG: hypothetical protein R3F17_10460 [Planctomycetota bacterium]
MIEALIRAGANGAALAVLASAGELDAAGLRRQAQLAAWSGRRELERASLEALCATDAAQTGDHARLVDLYLVGGEPLLALQHARQLPVPESGPELAVRLALEAGDVDQALELVRGAQSGPHQGKWQETELRLLESDLRFGELEETLAKRFEENPKDFEQRYESVLLRLRDEPRLIDLWYKRLQAGRGDGDLRRQVLSLALRQGRRDVITSLLEEELRQDPLDLVLRDRLEVLEAQQIPGARATILAGLRNREAREEPTRQALLHLGGRPWDPELVQALMAPLEGKAHGAPLRTAYAALLAEKAPTRLVTYMREQLDLLPGNSDLLVQWADVAAWQGDREAELQAREALTQVLPRSSQNWLQLADLRTRREGARAGLRTWQQAIEPGSFSSWPGQVQRAALQSALDARDRAQVAEWAAAALADAEADSAVLASAAEGLAELGRFTESERAWLRVLERNPRAADAHAGLARLEMERRRPDRALPHFEALRGTPQGNTSPVRYLHAEALTQAGRTDQARELYATLARGKELDPLCQEIIQARALLRIGRTDEGLALLEAEARKQPEQTSLWLELAQETHAAGKPEAALVQARGLAQRLPSDERVATLLGNLCLETRRFEEAEHWLMKALDLGADPAPLALQLSQVEQAFARPRSAAQALALHLDASERIDPAVPPALQRLRDEARPLLALYHLQRSAGNDRVEFDGVAGTWLFEKENQRLFAGVGEALYRGEFVGSGGLPEVQEQQFLEFALALEARRVGGDSYGLGMHAFPDAPGADTGQGWLGLSGWYRFGGREQSSRLRLGLELSELWSQPAGAVTLGGRVHRFKATQEWQISGRTWSALEASVALPSVQVGGETIEDRLIRASWAAGRTLRGADSAVASPMPWPRFERLPESPYLGARPKDASVDHLGIWAAIDTQQFAGDADLPRLLPIADQATYGLAGMRYDRVLGPGLGGMVSAQIGLDLDQNDTTHALEAGLTWRPRYGIELVLQGLVGKALGRTSADDERLLLIGLHLRR